MKNKKLSKKTGCMVVLLLIFCISHLAAEPCGDVNSDGAIDIIDALLVAQYYVDLDPADFDSAAADVSGDGSIDIVDALLLAQYYVGLISELPGCTEPPTPGPTPGSITYELQAEDAEWSSGGTETDHNGYTGTGYVNTDNSSGEWIEWSIEVGNACNATCVFRYACESDARPMSLSINNTEVTNLGFPASGAWTTWITGTADVILSAGSNKIRLTATGSSGAPNMDKMDITIFGGAVVTPIPTIAPTPIPTSDPNDTPGPTDAIYANSPVGFASLNGGTTGGEGGQTVIVSNQSDLERYAGASEPHIIKVQGSIKISPSGHEVNVTSNKTIVGIGADATIRDGGFRVIMQRNVIIRNLTIRDISGGSDADAIQVDTSVHIWFDHCFFTNGSDGLMDLRKDCDYVTVSWCIFSHHNKCWGIGWTPNVTAKMTLHHNWIHDTVQRNPSFDNAIGHLYNNFLEDISSYGNYIRGKSIAVIENSYYVNVNDPWFVADGEMVTRGNKAINCSGRQDENKGDAFDPSSYYSYTLDPTDDVPDLLRTHAGPSDKIQY